MSVTVVWRWRQAFGVSGTATTPGSKKAHRGACQAAAEVNKARVRTKKELDALAEAARRRNQARYLRLRWTPANGGWTKKQLALLGTADDEVAAEKLGRTVAVRVKRIRLNSPVFRDRRRK